MLHIYASANNSDCISINIYTAGHNNDGKDLHALEVDSSTCKCIKIHFEFSNGNGSTRASGTHSNNKIFIISTNSGTNCSHPDVNNVAWTPIARHIFNTDEYTNTQKAQKSEHFISTRCCSCFSLMKPNDHVNWLKIYNKCIYTQINFNVL